MNEPYDPLRIHVASVESGISLGQPSKGCDGHEHVAHFYTVVLTSTKTNDDLLPLDTNRCYAEVQAGGNNAVICETQAEAQSAANSAAGQPNPIGMILPAGNTVPTRIPGGQHLYCAAAAYPTQVTVMAVQRAE